MLVEHEGRDVHAARARAQPDDEAQAAADAQAAEERAQEGVGRQHGVAEQALDAAEQRWVGDGACQRAEGEGLAERDETHGKHDEVERAHERREGYACGVLNRQADAGRASRNQASRHHKHRDTQGIYKVAQDNTSQERDNLLAGLGHALFLLAHAVLLDKKIHACEIFPNRRGSRRGPNTDGAYSFVSTAKYSMPGVLPGPITAERRKPLDEGRLQGVKSIVRFFWRERGMRWKSRLTADWINRRVKARV